MMQLHSTVLSSTFAVPHPHHPQPLTHLNLMIAHASPALNLMYNMLQWMVSYPPPTLNLMVTVAVDFAIQHFTVSIVVLLHVTQHKCTLCCHFSYCDCGMCLNMYVLQQ